MYYHFVQYLESLELIPLLYFRVQYFRLAYFLIELEVCLFLLHLHLNLHLHLHLHLYLRRDQSHQQLCLDY